MGRRPFHGGNLLGASRKYGLKESAILDFSASVNPFGIPDTIKDSLTKAIGSLERYPDPECTALRAAIASCWQGLCPENILAGNGSAELIYLIVRAFLPKKAIILIPTFSEYEHAVRLIGGKCLYVRPNPDLSWPVEFLLKRLPEADMVLLCRPNSPTGYFLPEAELNRIAASCKTAKVKLVIDETFLDLMPNGDNHSYAGQAARSPWVIVLRSFTKLYALPGLRLGYTVAAQRSILAIKRLQPPWMVNTLAQVAGIEALKHNGFKKEAVRRIEAGKVRLMDGLSNIPGLLPYPAAANFILCRVTSGQLDSGSLAEKMAQKGFLIRDCSSFRGLDRKFIRIAVRKDNENDRLVKALQEVMRGD